MKNDPRLQYAWGMRFLYQIGLTSAWIMVVSIWLQEYGKETLIWYFLAEALFTMAGAYIALLILPLINRKSYLLCFLGASFLLVLLSLTSFRAAGFMPILLLFGKSMTYGQISTALNRQVESLFSPSEAKNAMPRIETGITFGAVVGTFSTLMLLWMGTAWSPLWAWTVVIVALGAGVVLKEYFVGSIPTLHAHPALHKVMGNPYKEIRDHITKTSFVQKGAIMIGAFGAMTLLVEWGFLKEILSHSSHAVEHGPTWLQANVFQDILGFEESVSQGVHDTSEKLFAHSTIAHELGLFHLAFAVLALFVQRFITPFWVTKLGVVRSWGWYGILLSFMSMAQLVGLCTPSVLRLGQHTTHSLGESPYHMSYYVLPQKGRESLRIFLEGIVRPLSMVLAIAVVYFLSFTYALSIVTIGLLALGLIMPAMQKNYTELAATAMRREDRIHDRLHLVEVMSQPGHVGAAGHLADLLKEEDVPSVVRTQIVASLGKSQSEQHVAIQTLLTHLSNPEESMGLKHKILEAFETMPELREYFQNHPWAYHRLTETFQEFLVHDNQYLKKKTVMLLFKVLPAEQIVPWFLQHMQNADEETKSIYLRSCGACNDPGIVHYITPYLRADNARLRSHAIMALWQVDEKHVLRKELDKLLASKRKEEVIAGLYAIGEIQDEAYLDQIWDLTNSRHKEVKLHALIAGGKMHDRRVLPGLYAYIIRAEANDAMRAWRMADRLPKALHSLLKTKVHRAVAADSAEILAGVKWRLNDLSGGILKRLTHLYRLADKYDDILALEHLQSKL